MENDLIESISGKAGNQHPLLFKMLPSALANIPFHENTDCVTRFVASNFPVHLAVHKVSPVMFPPVEYTQPHRHTDHDEINIIIAEKDLRYKIQLGQKIFTVDNNTSIWIPKGTLHAANVLQGTGFFITLRL